MWKKKAKGKKRKTKHTLGDSINLVQISVQDLRDQVREEKYSKGFVFCVFLSHLFIYFEEIKRKKQILHDELPRSGHGSLSITTCTLKAAVSNTHMNTYE